VEDAPANPKWFQMEDIWTRKLNDSVWIPLRANQKSATGKDGHLEGTYV
jgi:hypothetical protein